MWNINYKFKITVQYIEMMSVQCVDWKLQIVWTFDVMRCWFRYVGC